MTWSKKTTFIILISICAALVTYYFSNLDYQRISHPRLQNWDEVKNRIFMKQNAHSTTLTFDTTLEVCCKESPFIDCGAKAAQTLTTHKTFTVSFLRQPHWILPSFFNFSLCQFSACHLSSLTETSASDAIIMNGVGLPDSIEPPGRWENQILIIALWESPAFTYSDFVTNASSPWNSRVNLVMSYRLDSDIFVPYGELSFKPKPLRERPNYYEIAKKKSRTAVWMVSNCLAPSMRDKYVEKMRKYIDVDIFGGCGQPCPIPDSTCTNMTATYKFYLSFENSLCTDYVTEKFFKLFAPGIHVIPVVRGGADYDKYFPNFTYINAAHFKTAKDLALHLKDLASDLKTYSKYLEYKDLFVLKTTERDSMACKMCEFLHTHKIQENKIRKLTPVLGDQQCWHPQDL